MTKLAILATLTNFILPTSFLSYTTQIWGEVSHLSYVNIEVFKLQLFSLLGPSRIVKILRVLKTPPHSYRRSNTPTVIGLKKLNTILNNQKSFQGFCYMPYFQLMSESRHCINSKEVKLRPDSQSNPSTDSLIFKCLKTVKPKHLSKSNLEEDDGGYF